MAMGVLLIILGGIFAIGIFIYFTEWASECEDIEADLKLSYKSFKSFYNMNPDAWKLEEASIFKRIAGPDRKQVKEYLKDITLFRI